MPDNYRYAALAEQDIRLVHLLNGAQSDEIRLSISHEALCPPTATHECITPKLPKGWQALRTPEGRSFFRRPDGSITYRLPKHIRGITQTENERPQLGLAAGGSSEQQIPQYAALSYAWGVPPERVYDAYVVDAAGGHVLGILKITRSLDAALRSLRSTEVSRTLWIDAISIDQENIEERGAQVLRMGTIYTEASMVIVWLGPATQSSDVGFAALKWLGTQVELADNGWWYQSPNARNISLDLDQPLPFTPVQWEAIKDVLKLSWFSRLWVIQEVSLASPQSYLQCGQDQISYHDLRRALAALVERAGVPNEISYVLNDKNDTLYGPGCRTVCNVLSTSRQHACSDPRDKIYGMLGFLGPKLRDAIGPSYSRDFKEVYQNFFRTYCRSTKRLDLLSQCWFVEETNVMPTWVPDWRAHPRLFRRPDLGWQAAGMSPADYRLPNTSTLSATGVWQDAVAYAHAPAREDDWDHLRALLREIQPDSLGDSTYVTGETMCDAWTRTLTVGAYHERMASMGYDSFQIWQEKVLQLLKLRTNGPELDSAVESLGNSNIDNLECMSYFATSQGYFGFGPTTIRPDDRICILLGLFTPLIVRPVSQSSYRVMGWCYVHGLMDSEALLGALPKPWRIEQHFLRRQFPIYVNDETGYSGREDPRLASLPADWRRLDMDDLVIDADDPVAVDYFRNVVTGVTINYDPRLTRDALQQRGIRLETIDLV